MTLNELISKLNELKKTYSGDNEIQIIADIKLGTDDNCRGLYEECRTFDINIHNTCDIKCTIELDIDD